MMKILPRLILVYGSC